MSKKINVTVWNEFRHEKTDERVSTIYPEGIHHTIADFLQKDESLSVRTATLDEPSHGLTDEVLNETDVLIWWGHQAHGEVADDIVEKVHKRVLDGMGIIVLHSGHASKIYQKIMGTRCDDLKWRETGERERLWVIEPSHPIAQGIHEFILLEQEEMYGECFEITAPDELIFISWFEGGEVFRSGCCYYRGLGRIFYFRPGHETFPIYHHADIQKVITNAVHWAKAPFTRDTAPNVIRGNVEPLEPLQKRD